MASQLSKSIEALVKVHGFFHIFSEYLDDVDELHVAVQFFATEISSLSHVSYKNISYDQW